MKLTPLHWAVEEDYPEIVKLLLQFGADPHAKSIYNDTPLTLAQDYEFHDIIDLMVQCKYKTSISMEEQQEATDSLMQEMEEERSNSLSPPKLTELCGESKANQSVLLRKRTIG